jgi:acetate kinase
VRGLVCEGLGFLGLELDAAANSRRQPNDRLISTRNSKVAVGIVFTNEELVVARESVKLLTTRA